MGWWLDLKGQLAAMTFDVASPRLGYDNEIVGCRTSGFIAENDEILQLDIAIMFQWGWGRLACIVHFDLAT